MSQKKKLYLEAIRVAAIILVIFNHTDGTIYFMNTDNLFTYLFSLIMTITCRAGVPMFFMVSGALLLDREESISELFRKRIARIAVVLLTVSLFYYVMDVIRYGTEDAGMADFLKKVFANGIRESLWFLYSYLAMLLALPFFRKLVKGLNRQMVLYLIVLRVFFAILIPLTNMFLHIRIYLDSDFVCSVVFYMLLGWYFENGKWENKGKNRKYFAVFALSALVVINALLMYLIYRLQGEYIKSGLDLTVSLTAPCLWFVIKNAVNGISNDSRIGRLLFALGGCSFGVYLFDNFVRWQLLPLYLILCEKTIGVFASSVYTAMTFLIGAAYTYLLKKMPIIRKYL